VNRYPTWKYALVALCVAVAALYTLPNFFGESPAVQVSSARATVRVDAALLARVESALSQASIAYSGAVLDANSVRVRFADTDIQLKAKDTVDKAVNPDPSDPSYIVALNLLSRSPAWLTKLHALPMYLGLDLRGGVRTGPGGDADRVAARQLVGAAVAERGDPLVPAQELGERREDGRHRRREANEPQRLRHGEVGNAWRGT